MVSQEKSSDLSNNHCERYFTINRSQVNGKPRLYSIRDVSVGRSPSKWSTVHVSLYLNQEVKKPVKEKKKKKMLL